MLCPRCGEALRQESRGLFRAHVCEGCGGVWSGVEQTYRAGNLAEVALDAGKLAEAAAGRAPFGGSIGTADIGCPRCGQAMHRIQYPRAGVVIDTCNRHGTWFDRGELQHVARLVGGTPARAQGPFRTSPVGVEAGGVGPGTALPRQDGAASGQHKSPEPPIGKDQLLEMLREIFD